MDGAKILIVDAEQVPRDLLVYSLQSRLGYKITAVASAQEAIGCFHADAAAQPDLVLFDLPAAGADHGSVGLKALSKHAPLVVLVKYGDY